MNDEVVKKNYLVDGDAAARLRLLGLGNHHGQDTIVKASGHGIVIDGSGECESARELANRALLDPVALLGLVLGLLGGNIVVAPVRLGNG